MGSTQLNKLKSSQTKKKYSSNSNRRNHKSIRQIIHILLFSSSLRPILATAQARITMSRFGRASIPPGGQVLICEIGIEGGRKAGGGL